MTTEEQWDEYQRIMNILLDKEQLTKDEIDGVLTLALTLDDRLNQSIKTEPIRGLAYLRQLADSPGMRSLLLDLLPNLDDILNGTEQLTVRDVDRISFHTHIHPLAFHKLPFSFVDMARGRLVGKTIVEDPIETEGDKLPKSEDGATIEFDPSEYMHPIRDQQDYLRYALLLLGMYNMAQRSPRIQGFMEALAILMERYDSTSKTPIHVNGLDMMRAALKSGAITLEELAQIAPSLPDILDDKADLEDLTHREIQLLCDRTNLDVSTLFRRQPSMYELVTSQEETHKEVVKFLAGVLEANWDIPNVIEEGEPTPGEGQYQ